MKTVVNSSGKPNLNESWLVQPFHDEVSRRIRGRGHQDPRLQSKPENLQNGLHHGHRFTGSWKNIFY
jgi:hypothetical protein